MIVFVQWQHWEDLVLSGNTVAQIDGLAQNCSNSSALAMELLQPSAELTRYHTAFCTIKETVAKIKMWWTIDNLLSSWGIKEFSNIGDGIQVIMYAFTSFRCMVIETTCSIKSNSQINWWLSSGCNKGVPGVCGNMLIMTVAVMSCCINKFCLSSFNFKRSLVIHMFLWQRHWEKLVLSRSILTLLAWIFPCLQCCQYLHTSINVQWRVFPPAVFIFLFHLSLQRIPHTYLMQSILHPAFHHSLWSVYKGQDRDNFLSFWCSPMGLFGQIMARLDVNRMRKMASGLS